MTITDFAEQLPASKTKPGREDFSNEKIMDLMETTSGNWDAAFWSSKYLRLHIKLLGNNIITATCDCGRTQNEDLCKHIIAMLYAIQHAKGLISEQDAFVISDPGLIGGASVKDRNEMTRYAKLIREAFAAAKDVSGHIYRHQTNQVLKVPEKLLAQAQRSLEEKKYTEAANIALTILETIPFCVRKMEYGNSSTTDILDTAREIIATIANDPSQKELIKRFRKHGMTLNTDDKNISVSSDATQPVKPISQKLYRPVSETNPGVSAKNMTPGKDSPALITALADAKKTGNAKKIEMYRQCILSERRNKNDKLGVREMALELFESNPTKDYLSLIKETYTQVEWDQVGFDFVEKVNGKK